MPRGFARTLLAVALVSGPLALSTACATILGIEELPVAGPDGGTSVVEASAPDVTPGCAPRGTTFCQVLCPVPDFCDDFEGPKLAEGWDPPFGAQNPLLTGEGDVTIVVDDAGTQTRVLIAEARSLTNDSVTSIIATKFDKATRGRKLRGVSVAANLRAPALSFDPDAALSKDPTLTMLAFGSQIYNQGVGISIYDEGLELRLGLQQRTIGGSGTKIDLVTLYRGPRALFLKNQLPAELIVGTPELLREQKAACSVVADAGEDAGGPNDVRALLRIGNEAIRPVCAALRGDLAGPEWLSSTVLFVGASVSDFGAASVRVDNVVVTLFE